MMAIQPLFGALTKPALLFLVLHAGMAVLMVGAGYVYPILLGKAKTPGRDRVPLVGVMNVIARGFTLPFIIIQPLTGLGLILTTRNLWNPFHASNRWLFAAIILFVVIFVLDTFLTAPTLRRLQVLAEAGSFDGEEFNKDLAMLNKVGPFLGILFLTITILMIWKPGAPSVHF